MISPDDICLISPIEQNKYVVRYDGTHIRRYFEQEAINMVKSWRKNGGWLKDIKIYFFNVNGSMPSKNTTEQLQQLGCVIFDSNGPYKEIGFLTEPLCGYMAETKLQENYLIKIDLDMQLLKPLPQSIIQKANDEVVIEQYLDCDVKDQRTCIGCFNPFDTCFMVSQRKSHFYETYYNLCNSNEILQNDEWMKLKEEYGMYFLEEFVVDYMFKNNIVKIHPVRNHIYGEGYASIQDRSDSDVDEILFFHHHLYLGDIEQSEISYKLEYVKRMIRTNWNMRNERFKLNIDNQRGFDHDTL